MLLQTFLGAAAVLTVGTTAIDSSVVTTSYKAASYQEASDLKNVSTYHALTRVKRPIGQRFKERSHEGVFGRALGYGLSPTTSFDDVRGGILASKNHHLKPDNHRLKAFTLRSQLVTKPSTS